MSAKYEVKATRVAVEEVTYRVANREPSIRGVSEIVYFVTIRPYDSAHRCSCPDHVYRRRECKHISHLKSLPYLPDFS